MLGPSLAQSGRYTYVLYLHVGRYVIISGYAKIMSMGRCTWSVAVHSSAVFSAHSFATS